MAVSEIHLTASTCLQKMSSFTVLLPEKQKGPFPVLYLLHGLSDDHTTWTRRTSLERYTNGLPMIVVMPNGERGWYSDSKSLPCMAFETYVTKDLVEFVDTTFNTIPKREGRAICGLSMGGYGAFKLALQHPDLYCAGVSFSGAVDMGSRLKQQPAWVEEFKIIFGDKFGGSRDDILKLLTDANASKLPALWMSCGTEDGLLEDNRTVHERMKSLGIQHQYREDPGYGHGWNYWDVCIQDALRFIADQFHIGR